MKKNMTKKKKTLAEELGRIGDWFAERDLGVGDVIRRVVALAVGLVAGSVAFVGWIIVGELGSYFTAGGGMGYGIASLFAAGCSLLLSCATVYLVWAIWTDEL